MHRKAPHPTTLRSTLRLSDCARHLIIPNGIVSTAWPARRDFLASIGVTFDRWEDDLASLAMAKTTDGYYAASVGGVAASIARQTGKTYTARWMTFAECCATPGITAVWTAHQLRTAELTFREFCAMEKQQPRARAFIEHIDRGRGSEAVRFKNGSAILFGAREQGFALGFDNLGWVVFDEAQRLTHKALNDLVPTMNVATNPLMLYLGTPPRPTDRGEAFAEMRRDALDGNTEGALYIEISADDDCDIDDREQWEIGNPGYHTGRTSEKSMLRMQKHLGSDTAFRREGLGVWDQIHSAMPRIDAETWTNLTTTEPPKQGRVSYGIKFSPDGAMVAIAAAIKPANAPIHTEVIDYRATSTGTAWLIKWLAERAHKAAQIVIDGKSNSAAFMNSLLEAGVPRKVIIAPNVSQVIEAHATILELVKTAKLTHFNQPALNEVVDHATTRNIGNQGGWGWAPIGDSDVLILEAATLAVWAAATSKRQPGRKTKGLVL